MTVLRDLEGCVHFVPNGEITSVTNMTHGWSRALFDIGVAYKENVDQVMEVILEVGKELRKDPQFRTLILEDPTMLGVDSFGDSAVVIKFFIKTRPLQQWTVKRELLRRLKNRFDELGIEIPFPHRTVYHHMGSSPVGIPEPARDGRRGHRRRPDRRQRADRRPTPRSATPAGVRASRPCVQCRAEGPRSARPARSDRRPTTTGSPHP